MFCVRVVCSSAALVGHNTPFIEIAMNFLRPLHRKTRHLVIRGLELRIIRLFTRIASVLDTEPVGNRLTVQGWVRAKRKMKSLTFVDVSDGSTGNHLQVAIPKKLDFQPDVGASVKVTGTIQRFGDKGQIELLAENVKLLGPCNYEDGYPFVPRTSYSMEYVRQHLDFRPRTNIFSSILRVRSGAANAFRNYLNTEGFFEVNAPVLTSCDCEGAGEVFSVKPSNQLLIRQMVKSEQLEEESFFNSKAFLSVSGQMHLESAVRGLGHVFSFGPTFRAENSKSRLHLAEFYMLEIEQILNDSSNGLETILSTIEKMLRKVTLQILDTHSDELEIIKRVQKQQKAMDTNIVEYEVQPLNEENIRKIFLPDDPYTVMTYKDAIDILTDARGNFKKNPTHQGGLAKEHELFLVEKNNNTPIFVTEWPAHLKPFYMKGSRKTPTVSAVDLLVPIVGELCGGSVRENDVDLLEVKMKELGLNEKMSWYINMRRFGNIKTGGFGMGFERYLQCLLNVSNIKDVIPFPRWPYNCYM